MHFLSVLQDSPGGPDDDHEPGNSEGLPRPALLAIFHRAKGGKENPSGFDISGNHGSNDMALWYMGPSTHPLCILSLLLVKFIFIILILRGHCVS